MPKYMINILYGDAQRREELSKKHSFEFIMGKYREWSDKISNQIVIAHKLKDEGGRTLEIKNGSIKDGPYTETKESIGGFYIVEAANYDEAVKMARDCPTLLYSGGAVEVREVEF